MKRRLSLRAQVTYGLLFGVNIASILILSLLFFWWRVAPGMRFHGYIPTGTDWLPWN